MKARMQIDVDAFTGRGQNGLPQQREERMGVITRRANGLGAANFGLIAILTRVGTDGTTAADVVAYVFAALAFGSAIVWAGSRYWTHGLGARIFGVFADVGTLVVLLTVRPTTDAISACVLFGVSGVFFTFYLSRRWLFTHVAFSVAVTVGFAVAAVAQGEGLASVVVRTDIVLAAVIGIAMTSQLAWTMMRRRTQMAATDPLTGIRNVRGLWHDAIPLLAESERNGQAVAVAVAVADIDGFKAVNDAHGHDVGDQVLVGVARHLAAHIGGAGFVARSGGEEFTALIAGPVETVRVMTSSIPTTFSSGPDTPTVTMSVGAAIVEPRAHLGDRDAAREARRRADRIMYEVKRSGGDGVGLHF